MHTEAHPHRRGTRRHQAAAATNYDATLADFMPETALPNAIYGGSCVMLAVHELSIAERPARVTIRSVVADVSTNLKLLASTDGEVWSVAGLVGVGSGRLAEVSDIVTAPYWRAVLLNNGNRECRRISVTYRVEHARPWQGPEAEQPD